MYKADFVCLAHNMFEEGVEDPVFTYANKAALELFEADWDTLIGLPSRNSAEPESQQVGLKVCPSVSLCIGGGDMCVCVCVWRLVLCIVCMGWLW